MAWRAGEFGFVYCREREPRKRAAESHQVTSGTLIIESAMLPGVPGRPPELLGTL